MAIYNNFSDVKDNAEFLDFIQKEFGIANLSQIADYEQTALLMSFKSHANDLSDADIAFIEEIRAANNKEDMEALTATELSTIRSFDQLSPAQQTYISVKTYDAKDKGISLEQITNDLQKRGLTNIREQYELADIEFYDFLRNTTLRHRSDELDKLAQEKYGRAFNKLGTDDMQAVIRQELEAERFDINELRYVYDNMTPERRVEVIAWMKKLDAETEELLKEEQELNDLQPENTSDNEVEKINKPIDNSFKTKADVYDAFHQLATEVQEGSIGEGASQVKQKEIRDFIARKEAYLDAHPEEKDEVNGQLGKFLNNQDQEKMFYGNELYTVDDSFRDTYQKEEIDYADMLMGRGRTQPTPQPTPAPQPAPTPTPQPAPAPQPVNGDNGRPPITVGVLPNDNENDNVNRPQPAPTPTPQPAPAPQPVNGDNGNNQGDDFVFEDVYENGRIRSKNSDENDNLLDYIRMTVMVEKGYLKKEDLPENPEQNPDKVIEVLQKINLTAEQKKDVDNVILDTFVRDKQLFEVMMPSKLAEAYTGYDERIENLDKQIAKEKDDAKKQTLEAQKNQLSADKKRVEGRIDELTDMLVADTHQSRDLFLGDVTNVADTYDGYNRMFAARKAVLDDVSENGSDAEKSTAQDRLQKLEVGTKSLQEQYNEYLDVWNLLDIDENSAKALDKRYESLNKGLKEITLDNETAKLVSNFKFLDAGGRPEPQFVDADGHQSDVWKEGSKVIEGSKLDKAITLSKQLFTQANLATQDELTPEFLQKSVVEYLPTTLHIMHNQDMGLKDVLEHPKRFTDSKFREEFINELSDIEHPMSISDIRFKAAQQNIVDMANGFRGVLAKQLKNENAPIVNKICNNIEPLDARAAARTIKTVNKDTVWRDYASNTLQGMAASAIGTARVKGAMMLGSAMVSGATGIAAGTVMLAASAAIPVGLSIKQYMSWRKERKAEGKSTKFKDMIKDKNLMATFATTALTEIAVGAALIPGGQPIAMVAGGAALAFGVGRAAAHDYKNLREAGKSRIKAGAAALCGAILKFGTAVLVNKGMEAAANKFGLFQEHHKVKDEVEEKSHIEQRETPELVAKAHHTLEHMYRGNPEGLEHDLAQVRTQLHAMGRDDISPEVFLRNACDAGMNTGTDTINYTGNGHVVHTHGNNLVLTDVWANSHGVNVDGVHALGGIKGPDGTIHITPEALAGHDAIKFNISMINEVGHTEGTTAITDNGIGHQAMVDENGHVVHSDGSADRFHTYANFKDNGYIDEKVIDVNHQDAVYEDRLVDTPMALGMYGIRKKPWINKLVERAGSLLDKIVPFKIGTKKKPVVKEPPVQTPPTDKTPPVVIKEPPVVKEPPVIKEPPVVIKEPEKVDITEDLIMDEYQII